MYSKFDDKEALVSHLKSEGFNYIVVDLNIPKFDLTPEKSLSKKFEKLINTLEDNPQLQLLGTNRVVQLNGSDQLVNAVFPKDGEIKLPGSIALFKIK